MEAALAYVELQTLTCEMCDNSSAAIIACVECQKQLCAPCQRIHDQVAGTKYHNLIAMEASSYRATGEKADGRQASGLPLHAAHKKFCKTHAKQELICHCCSCDVLICPVCRETSHQGHDTEDLNAASERIQTQVRDLLGPLEVKIKATTEIISEVSRTEQDLERQRRAVVSEAVEAAGKVSAWANQAEDKLVREVNKMTEPVKDELLKRKTAAREVNATLVLLQDRAKLVMKAGSYAELQSLRSDLKRSLVSDVTQSLEKDQGQLNPFVHADADNVNSVVNSSGVCMSKDVKTKDTVFFKRRSSGQEILQNTVPRYVGAVTSGQAEDVAKTTAFRVYLGQQFEALCVDLNGDGLSVLICVKYDQNKYRHLSQLENPHPQRSCVYCTAEKPGLSQQNHLHLMRCNLKGENIGNYAFPCSLSTADKPLLLQPWPKRWLISVSGQLKVLQESDQCKNDDSGQLSKPPVYFQGVMSNSSPNGHVYTINGSDCVYEIQQNTLDPDGNISVKPFFQVVHINPLHGFDVSADEAYFATVNSVFECVDIKIYFNVKVNVYRRLEAQPCARFTKSVRVNRDRQTKSKGVAYEACLCFSRYEGKEMLRLSVACEDCVYVLDHKKGCTVVHQMAINYPMILKRDCRERVWVVHGDHYWRSVVAFET